MNSQNPFFELLNVLHYKDDEKKVYRQTLVFSALSFRLNSETTFKAGGKSIYANTNDISFIPQNLEYDRYAKKEDLIVFHFNTCGHISEEIKIFTPQNPEKYRTLFCNALEIWHE